MEVGGMARDRLHFSVKKASAEGEKTCYTHEGGSGKNGSRGSEFRAPHR